MKRINKIYKVLDNALIAFSILFLVWNFSGIKTPNVVEVVQNVAILLDPLAPLRKTDPSKPIDYVN